MKVKDITLYREKIKAIVKINLIKFEQFEIPTKHLMQLFSDPTKWDELTEKVMNDDFDDFANLVKEMYYQDNRILAELLLKIAGKHPNQFENEYFKEMLTNSNPTLRKRLRNI